jgi:hypothetical protein
MTPITYKEFKTWCNERAQDGQWGFAVAQASIIILDNMKEIGFWSKKKVWREKYATHATALVEHTTRIAEKLAQEEAKCNRV